MGVTNVKNLNFESIRLIPCRFECGSAEGRN